MAASHAANSDTFNASTPSDREIALTRLFDAPKHLVFEALTRPEHVRRWWGILDERYSVVECDIDLRPGGKWRFVGKHPGGTMCFYGVYREIAPPHRLVFTEIYEPFPHVESVVTTVLTTEQGKTRMTVTALYPSQDVRDGVLQSGMEHGAAKSYDKLEEVAASLQV
ncbi:MAG TPA: SRPBCC family protein [Vicinamibacterales bacterium]|nr:SRPBCC family protein [Vicinamibacterales bacterium]